MTVRKINGKWFDVITRRYVGASISEVLKNARCPVAFRHGNREDTLA